MAHAHHFKLKNGATRLERIVHVVRAGGVGVMPTDTIYGIVGSALDSKAVERVYRVRRRNPKKPVIILIGSMNDLALFGIAPPARVKKKLGAWWPGKVSVVLSLPQRKSKKKKPAGLGAPAADFAYLHRGTKTLAFRVPKPAWLRGLLTATGPLIAPSANVEGEAPARTVREAKNYFGDAIDFYLDGGARDSKPSTLVKLERGKPVVLRRGAARNPRFF